MKYETELLLIMTRPFFLEKVPNILLLLDYWPNFIEGEVWNVQPQLYNVPIFL